MENVSPREYIKKLYKESRYLDTYGGSVVGAVAIIIVVGWAVSYQYIQIHMNYLRQNWNNYKCHPGIMPFAGQIKLTPGMTPFQFTTSNFSYCLNEVLVDVVRRFMEPILNMNKVILQIFDNVLEAFKVVEKVFNRIKDIFESIINYIMSKTVSIYVPLQKLLINLKDSFRKTGSIMGVLTYLIMGLDFMFFSGSKTLIIQIAIALAIGAAAIALAFLLPPLWPIAIAAIVVWVASLVATVLVYEWIKKIRNMTNVNFPPKPTKPEPPPVFKAVVKVVKKVGKAVVKGVKKAAKAVGGFVKKIFRPRRCFYPDTLVTMEDGSTKKMCEIKVGDILKGGTEVEAVMTIMGDSDNVFYLIYSEELEDDIMVTGTHKIFSKKQDKYVFVSEHEDAKKSIFWSPQLSCLITDDHTIPIGEYTFWDWEDED
jgi:hypothetical protein